MKNIGRNVLPPAAIFVVNAYITLRLFHTAYTPEMGSIEAAFIGLARYIVDHFPDLNWFPLWYGGIPYPDSYPPLLHMTVAAFAAAARISPAVAYHAVVAMVFSLTPVALYWTARRLGASRLAAFGAGLLYSIAAPSGWFIPVIRHDSGGWLGPHRLLVLVRWGEGPHLASMLFLVLAIGCLHIALARRTPLHYFAAALAVAATVLSNWIGAFALVLAAGAYLLAGFSKRPVPHWLRAAAIGAWAYALAMPWATPGTLATIRANAPLVGGKFAPGPWHPLIVAAFAGGLLLLAWAMHRRHIDPALRFSILFLYGTGFITLGGSWFQFRLLPQPERYHMEMDMAFCLAASFAVRPLAARVRGNQKRVIAACAIALACLPVVLRQRRMARDLERPIDITATTEYKVSRWLGEHRPGRRVMAPGTIAFWMNAFSDTPLLNGGFDNGMRNTYLQDVGFQILFGDKLETALAWLEAFGCEAVVGGDPGSSEVYHPYNHPEKFHSLPELWREGAEVIYDVPWHRRSLAHAVRAEDMPAVRPPAYDASSLRPYLAALEDPALPAADFQWHGSSAATVTANLRPDHLLSIQVTWDEGWHALVGGEARAVWSDKLGQMLVQPRCNGPCTVELIYDGGLQMRLARWISCIAFFGGILWIVVAIWRKRSVLPTTN